MRTSPAPPSYIPLFREILGYPPTEIYPSMANSGIPAGIKFSPSEEEAMMFLKRKILKQELRPFDVVPTVDVYSCADPRQIPLSELEHGLENEWYFFTNKREENLIKTTKGCWEERGEYEIIDDGGETMGFVRILDFHYSNLEDMEKVEWYIQEHKADPAYFATDELVDDHVKEKISKFVLCKVVCKEQIPSPKPSTNSCSDDMMVDDDEEDNEVPFKKRRRQ